MCSSFTLYLLINIYSRITVCYFLSFINFAYNFLLCCCNINAIDVHHLRNKAALHFSIRYRATATRQGSCEKNINT